MFLTIYGPVGHKEELAIDSQGMSLGTLFPEGVDRVSVNGREREDWRDIVAGRGDRVEVVGTTGDFGISAAVAASVAASVGATAGTVAGVVTSALIALTISAALSGIMRALTPKPKKPKLDSNREEAFGIAGFQNTTGRGTPAFPVYGQNRVWGHVLASGATLSPDGKQMYGKILYFMGATGGDAYQSITDIMIDGTSISQYQQDIPKGDGTFIRECDQHVRPGFSTQIPIDQFNNDDDLWTDGRQLDFNPDTTVGIPIIYTTKKNNLNQATLFFSFPSGLYRVNSKGNNRQAGVRIKIEIQKNSLPGTWVQYAVAGYFEMVTSAMFKSFEINFPTPDKWDIRLTVTEYDGYVGGEAFVGTVLLFNVQETVFGTKTYPGWALLGLVNIPAKKFRSLEGLNVSAVVEGKRVKVPLPGGGTSLQYTRKRCWIVRDILTHPVIGMGWDIAESEIDDEQWLESQAYYDEIVTGHDGTEVRDLCDFVMSESDWDWEIVKRIAAEGRGRIVPSGDKWKYVIDKPGTPNLLYTEGANIIDGTIQIELSPPDRPFTQVIAQFRDVDKDYEENFTPPIKDPEAISTVQELVKYETITRESEAQRENMIVFKRNFLERRRWSFQSPLSAIVSEPMDLDYLGERGIGNEGSYTGLLPAGSTTFLVDLPNVVTLDAGATYALIVKHHADNTTEYRTVINGAGVWGQVTPSAPFVQAPGEGDVFSLGKENVDHIVTRAQELEIDRDGRIRQIRTEYVPAVYTQDPLPPKSARRFFNLLDNRLPIPLRDAQVREEVVLNRDGSIRSMLIFNVTPGLGFHSGLCPIAGTVNGIVLAALEPDRDDYFNTARVTVTAGTAAVGQTGIINDYVGLNKVALLAFNVAPAAGDTYVIQWEKFAEFGGFRVEMSDDGVNFSNYATTPDTRLEQDGRGAGPGLIYFRFTPRSFNGVENTVARVVRAIQLTGDLSAPDQPIAVDISSYLLVVTVRVYMALPVAEDFSGVEVEIWRNAISVGTLLEVTRFGAPSDSRTTGTGGTDVMTIEATFNLGSRFPPETYGTAIFARARAVDFSQNMSDYTTAPGGTTLTPDPGAAGVGGGGLIVPTGLTLSSGSQIDPVDGIAKIFLNISWDANPSPFAGTYEVQYRQVGVIPVTVRMISHPQISIREIGVLGNTAYEARIQAIDGVGNPSGFTPFTAPHITGKDNIAPGPPAIFVDPTSGAVIGLQPGFKQISLFFDPPNDPDFECVQVYLSTVNNLATAQFWGESAAKSISFVATGLANDTQYFIWLCSRDKSGNVGPFAQTQFNGLPARTLFIGPFDISAVNALITGTAQIGNAVITNAHIQSLLADKIIGGNMQAVFAIGVGDNIQMDGVNRRIFIHDGTFARVVAGSVDPPINSDYGIQIFGSDGQIWHSFTSGTQTAGRQQTNRTQFDIFFDINTSDENIWISSLLVLNNQPSGFTVRVVLTHRNSPAVKAAGSVTNIDFIDQAISNPPGNAKRMTVTVSVTNIVIHPAGVGQGISATILVDYW